MHPIRNVPTDVAYRHSAPLPAYRVLCTAWYRIQYAEITDFGLPGTIFCTVLRSFSIVLRTHYALSGTDERMLLPGAFSPWVEIGAGTTTYDLTKLRTTVRYQVRYLLRAEYSKRLVLADCTVVQNALY
eukprot:157564-Rhodomonas_salina.2